MARKIEKKICTCCGKELQLKEFYKSASTMYDGKLPICKNCLADRFNQLLANYEGKINQAGKHICYNLDLFYDEGLYLECASKDNFVGEYMRLLATKNRRDKTSLNNLIVEGEIKEISLDDGIVTEELVDFWGEGYTASEYRKLEKKYKMYSDHYPNKKLQEQEMIKQLCELDLMKESCRRSGDKNGYDKICTQIRKAMDDLRILPKQTGDDDEDFNVGHIAELIEYYEPIPMTTKEFDDVNHIEEYIERFMKKPFRRVFGLENRGDGSED